MITQRTPAGPNATRKKTKIKVAVICSPGGHLAQSISVLEAFKDCETFMISYAFPNLKGFQDERFRRVYLLKYIRGKRVGLFITLFISLFSVLRIFFRERPEVLFSTGSEIAIVPFWIGKFLFGTKLIFLETASRVSEPSLTGKILYPVSDLFLVQWPSLLEKVGKKALYRGCVYDLCNRGQ